MAKIMPYELNSLIESQSRYLFSIQINSFTSRNLNDQSLPDQSFSFSQKSTRMLYGGPDSSNLRQNNRTSRRISQDGETRTTKRKRLKYQFRMVCKVRLFLVLRERQGCQWMPD